MLKHSDHTSDYSWSQGNDYTMCVHCKYIYKVIEYYSFRDVPPSPVTISSVFFDIPTQNHMIGVLTIKCKGVLVGPLADIFSHSPLRT